MYHIGISTEKLLLIDGIRWFFCKLRGTFSVGLFVVVLGHLSGYSLLVCTLFFSHSPLTAFHQCFFLCVVDGDLEKANIFPSPHITKICGPATLLTIKYIDIFTIELKVLSPATATQNADFTLSYFNSLTRFSSRPRREDWNSERYKLELNNRLKIENENMCVSQSSRESERVGEESEIFFDFHSFSVWWRLFLKRKKNYYEHFLIFDSSILFLRKTESFSCR